MRELDFLTHSVVAFDSYMGFQGSLETAGHWETQVLRKTDYGKLFKNHYPVLRYMLVYEQCQVSFSRLFSLSVMVYIM